MGKSNAMATLRAPVLQHMVSVNLRPESIGNQRAEYIVEPTDNRELLSNSVSLSQLEAPSWKLLETIETIARKLCGRVVNYSKSVAWSSYS